MNDVLVDGNDCTDDLCANDQPIDPPRPANATCSQGTATRCNGSETAPACVECIVGTDCPGTDGECHARSCTNGVCGVDLTPAGMLARDA